MFIAYYMHWSFEEVLALSHKDRLNCCRHISDINKKQEGQSDNIFEV